MLRVGLTGGIASGKSTVAHILSELGCVVIDADQIVRDLYEPGEPGYAVLLSVYGPAILDENGEIDRGALSATALDSKESATQLNSLIHPLVISRQNEILAGIETAKNAEDVIAVVEATLLLESGGRSRYDRIVVVDVDPETQVERAVSRGMNEHEVRRRCARQMERSKRLSEADYIVDNSGSPGDLRTEVGRVFESLSRDLKNMKNAPPDGGASEIQKQSNSESD